MKRKNTITELNKRAEIRLINRFIEQCGFNVGDKVIVTYEQNKIIIEKELPAKVQDSSKHYKLF